MQVARFLEIIGAQNIVELFIQGVAEQLQFLAELPLVHGEAQLHEIERRSVRIEARIPVQLAIGGDRFEGEIVG